MVELFAMTCGRLEMDLGTLLEGETGRLQVPVPSYLIRHPRGTAIFDSGLHVDTQTDPAARLGKVAQFFSFDFSAGEEVGARLESLDTDPGRIDFVINSHLHFDHAGGNAQVPNARVVIQRPEWEATQDEKLRRYNGYNPADFDLGQELVLIDGQHDLFGDGSVVCMPTYGHTPGHQSLRVKLESGEVVLCGDCCYLRRSLENLHLPGILHDRDAMIDSLNKLRALQAQGATIFYGHDPEFWKGVPQLEAL